MNIYERTSASFAIDARDINGQKIDALALEGVVYKITNGIDEVVKTLTDGLRIESERLFVDIGQEDINFKGRAAQEIIYSTDGVNYQGATLRPRFISIIGRN